jgi:RHS repeat-associated protein
VPTPTGTALVPGSVTTSVGTVNSGPNASVNVGSLPFLAAATIRFDLTINSPLPAGMTAVTAQGTVASNELADLLTDDPHTVAQPDATVITVGAGSGGGGGGGVPGVPGPAIGTVSPAEGTVITEPIDISAALTPPAGETVTAWTVSYHLEGDSQRTEIASGTGNSVAATIDPTVMPNGAYVIEVRAEGSAGGVSVADTSIVVDGQLKLGRYVTTYQDLAVGVAGLPMQVLRKYDSFDKSVGDFGVGWTLELAQFQVATNGPLGQGGWRMFGCGPGLIFVPLCFESAGPHYVAVTWPDGRVETFDLTPARGSSFLPGLTSAKFTARPRTTSTLEAVDSSLYYSNGDLLGGFFGSEGIYDPTRFRLTDKFGTAYLLDRALGLISATDRNGNTLTITPNGVISSLGPSITFTRDGLGRITKVVGPASETITYGYDAAGDLTSFTSPLEDTFTYSYDDNHNLEISRDPQNRPFRTISYDDAGRMESITDGVGNTTLLDVSLGDRRQIITDPTLELTTIVYQDESGDVVRTDQIFDGRTVTTRATYDDLNRKRTETDALGGVTRYDWDAKGNLTYVEDQEGRGTTMTYDEFGLPKTIKTHDGTTVLSLFYDVAGNLERQETADGTKTRYTWEGGRLRTVADDFGHTSLMAYTPEGWISELTTADGQARSFTYDDSGRTLTVTEPGAAVSTFTYDGAGNVLTAKDPTNNVRRYTYDAFDRLETETDYADKTTTYTYDTAGRLERRTDRNGQVVQYTYDAAGRVASKTLPAGVVTTYDYDPLGRPVDLSGPNGRIEYGYDDGNRLVSQRTSGAAGASQPTVVLGFGYDDAGVQNSANGPLGPVTYSYDEKLRLDGITAPAGAFGLTYDDHDRLTGLTRPNGVTDVLTYTPTGQLESRVSRLGATVLTSAAYTYGQGFLRTSLTDLAGVHAFTFDGFGRVTSATHPAGSGIANESFTYNNSGNRTSWTGSPAPSTTYEGGRLTGDGRYTYEYDFEGNLVERTRRSTGAVTTFHWNAEHQLLSVDHPGGTTSTYRYDPVGRRIEVNDNGAIRRYAYDGPNVVAEYNGSNTLVRAYLTTDAAGEVLASRQGAAWHYYSVDGLGSVTAITDGTGAVERRLTYDSFGALQGTPSDETYSFAGHQFDAATGLYQARARYYDPTVGRFISEDPIPSLNSYAYAANDPVNLVDTNGCQVMAERGLLEKIRAGIGRVVLEELAVAICQELVETALLGFGGGPNLLGSAAEDVLGDALGPQAHPQVGLGNRRPDWRLGFFDFFESKNTKSLALTRQLRETAQLVLDRGGQYFIVTRASTAMNGLSGPLRRFVASTPGVFIIGCLPG